MVQDSRPNTSEYRRSFKESKFRCFTKNYEDCLDYRMLRRSAEHNHNTAVFSWDDSESSTNSDSDSVTDRPRSVPINKYKHERFTKAYQDKQAASEIIKLNTNADGTKVVTSGASINKRGDSLRLDLPVSPDGDSHIKGDNFEKSPKEDHKLKPGTEKKPSAAKSPFVPYGYKDNEMSVSVKKTHNVRAAGQIHPSAIRAMQRRKLHMEEMDRISKSAPLRERRKKALFNNFDEQMKRETQAWGTEYRCHYLGYGEDIYSKSLSARFCPVRRPNMDRLVATCP